MFEHLRGADHRLTYMFRNYKMYHKRAMDQLEEEARAKLLQHFAEQIWRIDGSGRCLHRINVVLNKPALQRIWPTFDESVDHSWKLNLGEEDGDGAGSPVPKDPPPPSSSFSRKASSPLIKAHRDENQPRETIFLGSDAYARENRQTSSQMPQNPATNFGGEGLTVIYFWN